MLETCVNNENESERICRALDKLSQMCQFPKFYLSNYFSDLKVKVDKQMATQFMVSPQNTQILSNWTEIIQKIENI